MSDVIKKIVQFICKLKFGGWLITKFIIIGRNFEFQYQKRFCKGAHNAPVT
jgi:hypothetical protein